MVSGVRLMIESLVIRLLGSTIVWLSAPRRRVWKILTASTLPVSPAIVTMSPARNGFSDTSITPEAMFDSESLSARPMARPAAPSTAIIDVIGTPITCSTARISTTSRIT